MIINITTSRSNN